jgi:hypothetical protein
MGRYYGRNGLGSQSRLIARIYHYKYFLDLYTWWVVWAYFFFGVVFGRCYTVGVQVMGSRVYLCNVYYGHVRVLEVVILYKVEI